LRLGLEFLAHFDEPPVHLLSVPDDSPYEPGHKGDYENERIDVALVELNSDRHPSDGDKPYFASPCQSTYERDRCGKQSGKAIEKSGCGPGGHIGDDKDLDSQRDGE
jgi:hypothetical protein